MPKPKLIVRAFILIIALTTPPLQATPVSIEEGKRLFFLERTNSAGQKMSCTLCHTNDPKSSGRTRANKVIEPMAPVVNPSRFADAAKTEKWFLRNCNDVLERACSSQEKESFILFMKSIK